MTNARQYIMLWLLLIMGSATAFSTNYHKVFGDDWTSAEQFVNEHHATWKPLKWKDEIETATVNGLYILKGVKGANFSIGRFQMKPSFAEEVEAVWNQTALSKDYGFVFNLQDGTEARRSRIRRLSTMEGQCRYLAIFIRLQFLRHPQLQQLPLKEQAGFLATIYNRSFSMTWKQACHLRHQKNFHTDIIATRHTKRYCYGDIAQAFITP